MNKYVSSLLFSLSIGIIGAIFIILTNIVFPANIPDNGIIVGLAYIILFLLFGTGGYILSRKSKSWKDGALGGAITAFVSIVLVMATFVVIDNVFINIVSQQADKIYAFAHQTTYSNMRDFINHGNLIAFLIVLPILTLVGAVLGALVASIRKLRSSRQEFLADSNSK